MHLTLTGITPIMFDKFESISGPAKRSPEQLLHLDGDKLVLPSLAIYSFLGARNTTSAAKLLLGKKAGPICDATLSAVTVTPDLIPFTSGGKPVLVGEFAANGSGEIVDAKSHMIVTHLVARLPKGIPNPKSRPILRPPWELAFDIDLYPGTPMTLPILKTLFEDGGRRVGLGTFRPFFGRFEAEFE